MLDSPRNGEFTVTCRTLYKIRVKKRAFEKITRSKNVKYSDFNHLFGIRKHELDKR